MGAGEESAASDAESAERAVLGIEDELRVTGRRFFLHQHLVFSIFFYPFSLIFVPISEVIGSAARDKPFDSVEVLVKCTLMTLVSSLVLHFMSWRKLRYRSNLLLVSDDIVRYGDDDRLMRIPVARIQVTPSKTRIGRWLGFVELSTPEGQGFSVNRYWYEPGALLAKLQTWQARSAPT